MLIVTFGAQIKHIYCIDGTVPSSGTGTRLLCDGGETVLTWSPVMTSTATA